MRRLALALSGVALAASVPRGVGAQEAFDPRGYRADLGGAAAAPSHSGQVLLAYNRNDDQSAADSEKVVDQPPFNPLRPAEHQEVDLPAAAPDASHLSERNQNNTQTEPPTNLTAPPTPDGADQLALPLAMAPAPSKPPVYFDPRVDPAIAKAAAAPVEEVPTAIMEFDPGTAESTDRLLAPQGILQGRGDTPSSAQRIKQLLPAAMKNAGTFTSAAVALGLVIALFGGCVWISRRGARRPAGSLPEEAFAVLGRAPLTSQSFAQLLRLGNKLILIAVAPDGAQTLAEVTDPGEVDRLAGLCAKNVPGGPSAEFQQVLAQLAREPARGFLGREASRSRRG